METPAFTVDRDKLEIVQTRVFEAPREFVWNVMTDPKMIRQWWGPTSLVTTVDDMDVRPGGAWRFVQRDFSGNSHAFRGKYREVAAPERLVQTFQYEGAPGHATVETTTLEELPGGNTRFTTRSQFSTAVDLEEAVLSGLQRGASESMDRFADLLARERVLV